ncbi:MAG TPA: GNAT family N-acetyltransferase [Nitrososphaerales archaeon]|nr:GNAT family N-acetyltransferase [Nitrososphaerales archaeon]
MQCRWVRSFCVLGRRQGLRPWDSLAPTKRRSEIASKEFLASRLASPNARIVIAERRGEILGFASIRRTSQREGELSGVVVLKGESGRGLGTRLVRKACDVALRTGIFLLTVKTEASNARAIGFYKKNGFVEMKKTTEKVGRRRIPAMVLQKGLRR